MTPPLDFLQVGEGVYRGEAEKEGIVFHLDRLRRKTGELLAELTVTCNMDGAQRLTDEDVIAAADLNLSSVRARQDRASLLAKRSLLPSDKFDWYGALEYLCIRVIQAERIGQPAVFLRDVPKPSPDNAWTIHGLPILKDQPEIVFGDGGTGKSLLALSVAGELERRGVPTLYADWETTKADHRERLEAIFGDEMPAVRYVRCEWPLVHEVDRLRRLVLTHTLQYVILDSVAFGCDGPPETAEAASAYFRALRQLRIGALLIAHTTKADTGDQRPFGSAFWHNGARSTWNLKRSAADADASSMTVAAFHRKTNHGPLLAARGLRVTFAADGRIAIRPADLGDSDDFAAALPTWQRMKGALAHGPLTLDALAEAVDAKADTVKKIVDRSAKRSDPMFTRLDGSDGRRRIALVERRTA